MTVTGRLHGRKQVTDNAMAAGVGDIERQARVAELRRFVATGRYEVNPYKLAFKIFVKAMRRSD